MLREENRGIVEGGCVSEYTTKVHGLKRPIPYRLAESELCSYEDARDECVCMSDYMTVFGGYETIIRR